MRARLGLTGGGTAEDEELAVAKSVAAMVASPISLAVNRPVPNIVLQNRSIRDLAFAPGVLVRPSLWRTFNLGAMAMRF